MQIFKNLIIFIAALILSTAACANTEDTAKYPEKTINIICTHGTGGDTDYNAQLLAFYLSDKLKVALEVQNIPGNNGATALNRFKSAEPDGYTLLATNTSALACAEATGISSHSFMDFEPVAVYGKQCGENIVVLASSPYKSMDDLLKAVNRRPNKIKIGV
ncbi:MAG: tripartite tricarboxylate transporter substrate binding protein, partial [Succinivibrio sp.]|nr:tripartite tricarboxylate transporter substrate binding protein [Succinivibrio sp.]